MVRSNFEFVNAISLMIRLDQQLFLNKCASGAKGKAFINQIDLVKPQLKPDHPKLWYPELWPVESVEIHEIGWK